MSIPITGWIIFILIFLNMISKKSLLNLLIFSLPFSAVSALDIVDKENSINAPVFISIFYLSIQLVGRFGGLHFLKKKSFFFFLFVIFCVALSFTCSGFFAADLGAPDVFSTARGVTQICYVVLGGLISLCVANEVAGDSDRLYKALSSLAVSMVVICILGVFQVVAYYSNSYYPYEFLNNNLNPSARGFSGIEGGMKRISSSSTEPSILAQFLLVALVSISCLRYRRKYFIACVRVFSVLVIIMSTSAIAYFGGLLMATFLIFRKFFSKPIVGSGLALVSFSFVVLVWFGYGQSLFEYKVESYSFNERFESIVVGWQVFMQSPLVGAGWGGSTVHSLPVGLLANGGLLVFSAFMAWFIYELRFFFKISRTEAGAAVKQYNSIYLAFIFMLVLEALTGFLYVYTFFWVFFGIVIGVNRLHARLECR